MRKRKDFENLLFGIKLTEDEKELPLFKNYLKYKGCPRLPERRINLLSYLWFLEEALSCWRKEVKQFGCLAPKLEELVEDKWPAYDFESSEEVEEDSSE